MGSLAEELWLRMFGFGSFAWDLAVKMFGLGSFAWDFWLSRFGLGSFALDLRLRIFGLVSLPSQANFLLYFLYLYLQFAHELTTHSIAFFLGKTIETGTS